MTDPSPFLRLIPHREYLEFPLGRHVEHDPRSRDFPFTAMPPEHETVLWPDAAPILDQAKLGACVGFTGADLLNTDAYAGVRAKFHSGGFYTNNDGRNFYHLSTAADAYPGTWPPTDTGSSGLGLAKALQKLGLIRGYTHAFGFTHFLNAIAFGPVAVGTVWTEDMFHPDADGLVHVGELTDANIAGGHEYMVRGANQQTRRVRARNHWRKSWGDAGEFEISFDDFAKLLANHGDVTILHA